MRNSEITKEAILRSAGILFNTKGYKATSISDITLSTGFTKGAIYRHFSNKDQLELETLQYLSAKVLIKLRDKVKSATTAGDKLRLVFGFFESYLSNSPIEGGCPLLNAATEADDAYPLLRKGASILLDTIRDSVITILRNGIKYKQIKENTDVEFYATLLIAALEGAIMMGKLTGNDDDMIRIIRHLQHQFAEIEIK